MKRFLFPLLFVFIAGPVLAQKDTTGMDTLLTGAWKGTSICQVRPSPCNDEIAVCHISPGEKPGIFHVVMNKLVNGEEEDMAVSDYLFDGKENVLTTVDKKRDIVIRLWIKGRTLDGTLVYENKVYRIIKLVKLLPGQSPKN